MSRQRSAKGFTLIELMMVVAMIGILAALGSANYQKFTAKAKMGEAQANLRAIVAAAASYRGEHGSGDGPGSGGNKAVGYRPSPNHLYTYVIPDGGDDAGGGGDNMVMFEGKLGSLVDCMAAADAPGGPGSLFAEFDGGEEEKDETVGAIACANLDGDPQMDFWVAVAGTKYNGMYHIFDDVNNAFLIQHKVQMEH